MSSLFDKRNGSRCTCRSLLVVLALSMAGYGNAQSRVSIELQPLLDEACHEWTQVYLSIPEPQKQLLVTYGVISVYRPALKTSFFFSEEVEPNCGVRGYAGRYFERVIAGKTNTTDHLFAKTYADHIVVLLWVVWPALGGDSKAVPGDGAFDDEKYNLLVQTEISDELIAPLLANVVLTAEVPFDICWVVFERPVLSLRGPIERRLWAERRKPKQARYLSGEIYYLAMLHVLGVETAAQHLRSMLSNEDLWRYQKSIINSLLRKIEKGEPLVFDDLVELEYGDQEKD